MSHAFSRLTVFSSLLFLVLAGAVQSRGRVGHLGGLREFVASLSPKSVGSQSSAFSSSYVTMRSRDCFLDPFLSSYSSELMPELTFGTSSEISALQVCLGSP